MPRDANGNYTLPPGNPVVSGTPISSSVHNSTNSDLGTAITDSLSRTGLGGMLAPLQFADGTAGSPSITFSLEATTGVFRAAAGQWAVTVLGSKIFTVEADGAYCEFPFYEWNGTTYVPLVNASDDYTITGAWDFTKPVQLAYDSVNFLGSSVAGKGALTAFNDPVQNSGLIRIVNVAPGPSEGKPGDIWLVTA
jgi:hypothetical protein